jgi:hypothetical protein
MELQFGPDHYTRDWGLLEGIASEWAEIRVQFRLGSKATLEQIKPHAGAILHDESPWCHVRWVRRELERDAGLSLHLDTCYYQRLKPDERQEYACGKVLPAVLLRLFWTVVRNAGEWSASRRPTDEHWLRIRNTRNLTEELRRAIKDLRRSEAGPEPTRPEGTPEPPRRPAPVAPGPGIPQVWYKQEAVTDRPDWRTGRPEDILGDLEEACAGRGLSERHAKAFTEWWLTSPDREEDEDRIARRHGLTRDELNAVIRRMY